MCYRSLDIYVIHLPDVFRLALLCPLSIFMILKTIVLVKLQEEQTTEDKKEKRRKRKEKKDKANVKPVNFQYIGKSQENKYEEKKSLFDQKVRPTKDVFEHMEGSALTEEHELPYCIKHKYDSPESSQDSNKRRKLVSSVSSHNKPGKITTTDEQPCSSGRDVETGLNQEAAVTLHRTSGSKRIGRRSWQREQFRDLIVNWNPPSLQLESCDAGGEDWLCGAPKRQTSLHSDEDKATTEVTSVTARQSYMSSSLQPRACYLPELDMYQLPYEVPF
ncbi:hypothetical protein BHE74_00042693 [Ensete ventricosum]|nr:hypothetical protein BHE74_00042693 [Ensete ventricosum]